MTVGLNSGSVSVYRLLISCLVSHQIGVRAQLMNGVPNGNHWIAIRPLADSGCPDAIGAVLTCWKEGLGDVRTVHCGTEYMNQNSAWIHFGLGSEPSYDSLVVAWPSGATTTHVGVAGLKAHACGGS